MAYNPPIGSIYHLYTTYILPSGGLHNPYHLLWEPETTIEYLEDYNKWLITMVIISPLAGVVGPLPNGRTSWLINGAY